MVCSPCNIPYLASGNLPASVRTMSLLKLPLVFQDRIMPEPFSGCWLWVGSLQANGYASAGYQGRTVRAHRKIYEILVAPIPDGLQLDHLCRVRSCCNPDHLEPVTPTVNKLRGISVVAINARKTHCVRGHPLYGANLRIHHVNGKRRRSYRQCRICKRIWKRNENLRIKNAA